MIRVWNFTMWAVGGDEPVRQGLLHEGPETSLEHLAAVGLGVSPERGRIKSQAFQ
jgi:hypothetical protein